ncbi:MAG: glutathione S-transferase N-terminal domain-containing protein [Bdellovibrionota bacterium]|nr:glutathione S-transferase N-terminal domain-containing protein [Deltaproteobacteria bacterium]
MVLYYFEACPFCQKVLHTIDQLNISDQIEFRDTLSNPEYRDALIQLNGHTQVPCLVIQNEPMLESDIIVQYLKANFG